MKRIITKAAVGIVVGFILFIVSALASASVLSYIGMEEAHGTDVADRTLKNYLVLGMNKLKKS